MTFPLFDLSGRRALITGSGRGLGLAFARGLHSHGASVVLSDHDAALVASAKASFQGSSRITGVALDVADEAQVTSAVDAIERDQGPIDILVNNAGMILRTDLLETTAADFERLLRVNVIGVHNVARATARHMVKRGRGKIVNIASIMSDIARPSTGPYTATKGAVKLLTKAMCAEWAPLGLNINAIGPGFIKTDMTALIQQKPEFNDWLDTRVPMRRWGKPDDLVGACIYLSSPASDFVNGHVLTVDGGILAVL